ncbi:hypothetical protein TcBrA4_0130330 [Trypanosoma cruzi]|nr:hypothetical protein TcBrA4_0130330 [Trypanosoma cruzi]
MRRLVKIRPLLGCWWVQRRGAMDGQAFFELYGRNPDGDDVDNSQSFGNSLFSLAVGDALPEDTSAKWIHALNGFSAQLYARPNEKVHRSVVGKALETLVASTSLPHYRRSRCSRQRWESALCVWNHADQTDHRGAALLTAVLYYNGKYGAVIQQVEARWLEASARSINTDDIPHALRLMSIYVLALSFRGRRCVPRLMMGRMKELAEFAGRKMRDGKATDVAREYKVFLCALDWYFHHTEDPREKHFFASTFLPLTPKKLCSYVFSTESVNLDSVGKILPPAMLFRAGMQYAAKGEKENLLSLFTDCKQLELSQSGFRLFQLSTRLGDMISRMSGVTTRGLLEVVGFCGTALSFDSLKKVGSTPRCRSAVLEVLSRMEGPDAYFAVRHVLFHHSAAEALTFQETHGDIFSGDAKLVWRTALQSMKESISQGDINWRESLSTALRLLSDAGMTSVFFQLLKESHSEGEGSSLMTASALGQATRRSAQWWRSCDVLDMIVSCNPPRTRADDLFLGDACLQTLYALRDAKRWKEALAFYTSLVPVMPEAAHGVLCSVVCGMPVSTPWEEALATAQSFGNVPEKFLKTLLCARDPDCVSALQHQSFHSWRYMLQGYAEGGRWRHALRLIKGCKEVELDAWVLLLRSAQRAPVGDLSCEFFKCLPQVVWSHKALLRLNILIAEGHGYLKELRDAFQSQKENTLVAEYDALVCFLMEGSFPSKKLIFTDEYVIHRLLMSPAPSVGSIWVTVGWTNNTLEVFKRRYMGNMKSFVQGHYKIHASCIAKKYCSNREGTFTLRVIPPHATLNTSDTLISVMGDVIVAYKPPGVEPHSYARLVAQRIQAGVMHYSAYHLSPSSCGLILLLASTIPTKAVHLEMKVLARVFPVSTMSLPLLSTEFYKAYTMDVISGPFSDGGVVVKAKCCSDLDGLLAGSFYRLTESLAGEGWGISLQESDTCSGAKKDEFVCLTELVLSIHHVGLEKERMYFSARIPPSCMAQLAPEEARLSHILC